MPLTENDYVRALDLVTAPSDGPQLESISDDMRNAILTNRDWASGPEIVGFGVTNKVVAGWSQIDQLAFVVYVRRKFPLAAIPVGSVIPRTVSLPGLDESLITDVVAIGELQLEGILGRVRPVTPGYSVGSLTGSTGTLGALVARQTDPAVPLLLSNSHVVADSGTALVGATVMQPGGYDGGQLQQDQVGALLDFVDFIFGDGYENRCDAAVASLVAFDGLNPVIPSIGVPQYDPTTMCVSGMQVQKTGRTTGHTVGTVQDVHFRTSLYYPMPDGGTDRVGFREQVLCSRYTGPGDSGALVCDMSAHAVGLHWCGSVSVSVFSPIGFVLDALKLQLWIPPSNA